MASFLDPFRFVLIAVSGWMNGRQSSLIDYLREENRVLREQLGGKRLHFTDDLALMLIDAPEQLEEDDSLDDRRNALAECLKRLRARDHQLLDACYGRSVRIPEVAEGWGRSPQSIHNSLRRIRRTLFECVRRSLAQEGGL